MEKMRRGEWEGESEGLGNERLASYSKRLILVGWCLALGIIE